MKKFAIEFKWGIRYVFAYITWVFIEKWTGLYTTDIADYSLYASLFYIFGLLIYIFALQDKKKHYFNGAMDWKRGTVSGIFMTVIIAVLMPLAQVIIHRGIAPEFFTNMITYAVSKGKKPEDVKSYFNLTSYIYQSVFFALSIGVLFGAVAAGLLQTKNTKN